MSLIIALYLGEGIYLISRGFVNYVIHFFNNFYLCERGAVGGQNRAKNEAGGRLRRKCAHKSAFAGEIRPLK